MRRQRVVSEEKYAELKAVGNSVAVQSLLPHERKRGPFLDF